jgi:LysM repeat protein
MQRRRRSPARFLAPIALIAVAVAVVLVVSNSKESADSGGKGSVTETTATRTDTTPKKRRANYTVKTGDTLGAIAEKTGVSVERLQELNPELDPQALVSGQKIKLRE